MSCWQRLRITKVNIFFVALTFAIIFYINEVGLFPRWTDNNSHNKEIHQPPAPGAPEILTGNNNHNKPPPHHEKNPPANNNNNNHNKPEDSSVAGGVHTMPKGAILVTGGMGNIGTALLKRLVYNGEHVICLDVLPEEKVNIAFKMNKLGQRFVMIQGDVRNHTLLEHVFQTHKIRGVVHLAGITKEVPCHLAPKYCKDVNVGGTEALLKVMSFLPRTLYPAVPWVIYASSLRLKNMQAGSTDPRHTILQTKLDAELLLWKYRGGEMVANEPMEGRHVRSISLRLGHVYGAFDADNRNKLVPRLFRNAVNHLPLHYYVEGMASSANAVNEHPHNLFEFVHMFDVMDAMQAAMKAMDTAGSRFSRVRQGMINTDPQLPPFTPPEVMEAPLMDTTPAHSADEDDEAQGSDSKSSRDEDIGEFDISSGEVSTIEQLIHLIINQTRSPSKPLKMPAHPSSGPAVFPPRHIPADLIRAEKWLGWTPKVPLETGVEFFAEDLEHRSLFYLEEKSKIYCLTANYSKFTTVPGNNYTVETHPMYLSLRDHFHYVQQRTDELAQGTCANFSKGFSVDGIRSLAVDAPICRNNNGSRHVVRKTWCDELMSAEQFVVTGWTRQEWMDEICGNDTKMEDLPTCDYDCDHPTICMRTGRCKCVEMNRCNEDEYPNPPLDVIMDEHMSADLMFDHSKLLPIIMKPLGRMIPQVYPKIHIMPLNNSIGEQMDACKGSQTNVSCFGVTQRIIDTLMDVDAPIEVADTHLIPFYHSCSMSVYRYYADAMSKFRERQYTPKSLLWIMAHDWSKCEVFRWDTESLRKDQLDRPAPVLNNRSRPPSFVLQTNGDTNTNCYDPEIDVIIPPEGCSTPDLLAVQPHTLKSMSEREIDVLHLATPMGTGGVLRLMLTCPDLYRLKETETNMMSMELQSPAQQWKNRRLETVLGRKKHNRNEYLTLLGNSRFCLCARGVAGWAPRVFDAIAMGCIPVLISDYTVYPFQDLLDYTKFAVFVREGEVAVLQDILREITLERMEEMLLALKIVRSSFLYDHTRPMLEDYTPIDWALRSLTLQMQRHQHRLAM